jgi:cell division transport system permease protein
MGEFMQSIKNHSSLVIALLSILFSMQIFIIVDRSITSYKQNLASSYSIVVVSQKNIDTNAMIAIDPLIATVAELTPDDVIKRLNTNINSKNIELLKLTLPRFYKLQLAHYPSPAEIESLTKNILSYPSVTKVEDFAHNHDRIYKLLILFKDVVGIFSISIFVVTSLLIFKELRIWQFKHSERMSIMGLFGAPIWLRSAVLFRLAIVDALIASTMAFILFTYMSLPPWILQQFSNIGITVVIFDRVNDFIILFSVAIFLSILLATLIVAGHKEEV